MEGGAFLLIQLGNVHCNFQCNTNTSERKMKCKQFPAKVLIPIKSKFIGA